MIKNFFIKVWNFFRKFFGFNKNVSSVEAISSKSVSSSNVSRNFHKVPRLICPPDIYGVQYVANRRYF